MTRIVILLLFMLISYAACDVKILNPEDTKTTFNGQGVKLRCRVTSPDVFDRWSNPLYKSSIQSDPNVNHGTNGDEHDLIIGSMNVFLAGVWTCHSQNNSDDITLTFSPSLVTPTNKRQTLIKDRPGAIQIDIRGYPTPDFVWKKDGVELNITGRYSVAHNGTLLISKVQSGDAGTYDAVGEKNFVDAKSGDITVTLLVAPSISGTSISESRTVGGNISFECPASGVPTPSITWKKGSTPITTSGGRITISNSSLLINNIQPDDVGDYTCVAVNSVGSDDLTSSLSAVNVPPVITPLSDQEVEKGELLTVACDATGKPVPTVEWSKDGNILPESQQSKSPGQSKLMLENIQTDKSGIYECSATNAAVDLMGKVIKASQSIQVSVVYPPEFQNITETIHTRLGQPITITCNAVGIPSPEVKLSYKSQVLETSTATNSTPSSLTYRINKTSADDLGVYMCTASNKLKSIDKDITLSVPLDKPEIGKVQTTCNSVSFSWSKDTKNYVDIESYHVTVTRATDERIVRATKVSSNTSQAMFTDLAESTKYKLTVKQITAAANIGYESSKIIDTIKCPLKSIHNVSTSGNAVTVYWSESKKNVDKYIVKYRIKGTSDWMKIETEAIFVEVSDLDYGETYEFQVFYNDSGKDMPYSEIREVSVPPQDSDTTTRAPDRNVTERPKTSEEPSGSVESPTGKVARKKGIGGGAIAAIVIVIILLVLIAVDIFCCFFNQCGAIHMCAAACAGRKREKYNVDGSPEEGTKLKEVDEDGKEEPAV